MAEDAFKDSAIICGNPDCRIAETGRCVEGLTQQECPNFGRMPDPVEIEAEAEETEDVDLVYLPNATTMKPTEASSLLRGGETRVIAIIGPSDAGKTSLIAGLYDLFQEGPVAGFEFARSRTLHAFERACHDARVASRRKVPRMDRTPRGEVSFYHLELEGAASPRISLALADRAGEEYREASDDPSSIPPFVEIQRADTITFLVDGERLLDGGARHNLRSEVTMILQALRDGAAPPERARLVLVLTKLDAIETSPHKVRAEQDFDRLAASIRDLHAAAFGSVETFKVAASPKDDGLQRGTGVDELLLYWLQPTDVRHEAPVPLPTYERAFARLQPLGE